MPWTRFIRSNAWKKNKYFENEEGKKPMKFFPKQLARIFQESSLLALHFHQFPYLKMINEFYLFEYH